MNLNSHETRRSFFQPLAPSHLANGFLPDCAPAFTFSTDLGTGGGSDGGGGGRGSSLDQDSLGGGMACEEQEVASLTTLHLDSETSSLSHTVTVTGTAGP